MVHISAGVIGTAKAVISEASDDSNQAFGIAIVACAWGVGLVLGSAVSGAVADPIGQYNLTISSKQSVCTCTCAYVNVCEIVLIFLTCTKYEISMYHSVPHIRPLFCNLSASANRKRIRDLRFCLMYTPPLPGPRLDVDIGTS